jgi:hypothetical protein
VIFLSNGRLSSAERVSKPAGKAFFALADEAWASLTLASTIAMQSPQLQRAFAARKYLRPERARGEEEAFYDAAKPSWFRKYVQL